MAVYICTLLGKNTEFFNQRINRSKTSFIEWMDRIHYRVNTKKVSVLPHRYTLIQFPNSKREWFLPLQEVEIKNCKKISPIHITNNLFSILYSYILCLSSVRTSNFYLILFILFII